MKTQGPLKVIVGLTHGFSPFWVTDKGIKFNDAFIDRVYEKEEFFRERIILQINEIADNDWAVKFLENPDLTPHYFVDITADDKFFPQIVNIVENAFPEISFEFWKPRPYILVGRRLVAGQYL